MKTVSFHSSYNINGLLKGGGGEYMGVKRGKREQKDETAVKNQDVQITKVSV